MTFFIPTLLAIGFFFAWLHTLGRLAQSRQRIRDLEILLASRMTMDGSSGSFAWGVMVFLLVMFIFVMAIW